MKIINQKNIIYVFQIILSVVFYLTILFMSFVFFPHEHQIAYIISSIAIIIYGVFGLPPMKKYLTEVTDEIFLKNNHDYSQVIKDVIDVINVRMSLYELFVALNKLFIKFFEVKNSGGVLFQGDKIYFNDRVLSIGKIRNRHIVKRHESLDLFKKIMSFPINNYNINWRHEELIYKFVNSKCFMDCKIIIPIISNKKMIGFIFLGEKQSHEDYCKQDMDILSVLSSQIVVVIERIKLFEKLQDYSKELEKIVELRTHEIKRMQEDQSRMMLDITHGLQTPLTVIKGELNFLQKKLGSNERLLGFEKSIDKVSRYVTALLKLAKLEVKENIEKTEVDFSELLNELIEYFSVLAKSNKINMSYDIMDGIKLDGNREQLEELITNIVSNSMKYIDNEKKIFISLKKEDGKIILKIKDTGVGIPKEDLKNIFNRFYRSHGKKKGVEGTGLGLAICKKIVDIHNGKIDIESELGFGSMVEIEFENE